MNKGQFEKKKRIMHRVCVAVYAIVHMCMIMCTHVYIYISVYKVLSCVLVLCYL